ncbi:MAG: ISL3 family transposase [Oligoflexia bacterium]|nr:ISL3 family transposase [Oligoflexia bacterium]
MIYAGIVNRNIVTTINWDEIFITRMGVDEIALRKGHKSYLTIVSDISIIVKSKILAVIDGRTKDEITPFFSSIPKRIWNSLESVTVDMSACYFSVLKDTANDDVIFDRIVTIDRFHVAKLLGNAVDKERKKVTNKLKEDLKSEQETLEQVKSTMWPFRHHPDDLEEDDKDRLKKLFTLAPSLKECYDIRENLYLIFESNLEKKDAKIKIDAWCIMAMGYTTKGHHPFEKFIETYYRYQENILNYFTHRHSSGAVEGLNNKIKVIERRGFGFRNILNFAKRIFLDINLKNQYIPHLQST